MSLSKNVGQCSVNDGVVSATGGALKATAFERVGGTTPISVVNIETGQSVGFLRFEAGVQEFFAVQVLSGTR